MTERIQSPAARPCGSCPYRRDVPSGVWASEEYAKLPPYDNETANQPPGAFLCHQQDGRLCAGWCAVHSMEDSLALRLLAAFGEIDDEDLDAVMHYTTDVPLFTSGAESAEHGWADIENPSTKAQAVVSKLDRKQKRR